MLKSADALAAAGYHVRMIATCHEPWATDTDRDVRSRRSFPVTVINYRRDEDPLSYYQTGARHRTARAAAAAVGVQRAPLRVVAHAFGRVHAEIVDAIAAEESDLIYGGTTGALAAIAEAARRQSTAYGLDLEDLHSGETSGPDAGLADALASRVEQAVVGRAAFITTSSEAIGAVYRDQYGVSPVVVHNTFPLPSREPDFSRTDLDLLRLYWFSQTIGPGRGLETAVAAAGRAGMRAELTLRGRVQAGYLEALCRLASTHAPRLTIIHQQPASPDAMVDLARGFDVGLALEQMEVRNRQLCVTNKAFTYILAGVAVAITDTPGQHSLGVDLGRAAALVPPGDIDVLAAAFARWASDPAALDCAKRTAWDAATRRWHWEHEAERGALYRLVEEALA
jgi:hypothetical protein